MREKRDNIKGNIPEETEREPVKIVEETTREQEPTVAGYLSAPRDEHAEELKILRNENKYLRAYVVELKEKLTKWRMKKHSRLN